MIRDTCPATVNQRSWISYIAVLARLQCSMWIISIALFGLGIKVALGIQTWIQKVSGPSGTWVLLKVLHQTDSSGIVKGVPRTFLETAGFFTHFPLSYIQNAMIWVGPVRKKTKQTVNLCFKGRISQVYWILISNGDIVKTSLITARAQYLFWLQRRVLSLGKRWWPDNFSCKMVTDIFLQDFFSLIVTYYTGGLR